VAEIGESVEIDSWGFVTQACNVRGMLMWETIGADSQEGDR